MRSRRRLPHIMMLMLRSFVNLNSPALPLASTPDTNNPYSPCFVMPRSNTCPRRRIDGNMVAARANWRCGMCVGRLPAAFEIDHLIPHCLTRDDRLIWALCPNCHALKSVLEIRSTRRLRRLQASMERNASLCLMCEQVVSTYFKHECTVDEEAIRNRWRSTLHPKG